MTSDNFPKFRTLSLDSILKSCEDRQVLDFLAKMDFMMPSLPYSRQRREIVFRNSNPSRLQAEKAFLKEEMPQFSYHRRGDEISFEGWQNTTVGNSTFYLKVSIPRYYPDQQPNLYVISPHTLYMRNFGILNDLGMTHAWHTLENGPGGCVQICHYSVDTWEASKTCVGVFMKGIIWLEAYCVSLETDMTIAEIIQQWERSRTL